MGNSAPPPKRSGRERFHQYFRVPLIVIKCLAAGGEGVHGGLDESLLDEPVGGAGGEHEYLLHAQPARAPLSVRQAKRSMHFGLQMDIRTALRFEVECYNQLVGTEDRREGIASFNEKRKPMFKGR